MTKTPDENVAEAIVAAFREKKLLTEKKLKDLTTKLATGSLKAGDWRRLAETEVEKKGEGENGKAN
jgi:hypothetical protein